MDDNNTKMPVAGSGEGNNPASATLLLPQPVKGHNSVDPPLGWFDKFISLCPKSDKKTQGLLDSGSSPNGVATIKIVPVQQGSVDLIAGSSPPVQWHSYGSRWWLVVSVVLLNLANYSHWVSFPAVTKISAKYYDQSGEMMDRIPTVSYALGIPFCLIATFSVEKNGLKNCLLFGGTLTGIGM